MTPALLTFEHVTKAFPQDGRADRPVLRDVSFALPAGATVALVGRSGSGKSTLLHLAAGIDTPTSGRIRLDGHDLAALDETARTRLRRDHVGLVFQFFHLLPHLSVYENVALPAWIAGGTPPSLRRRINELLERVELADRARDPIAHLSGGEMQRVALCRALLRRPRLLLADEPTGNLDDDSSRAVMQLLFDLVQEHDTTLLYVTHSAELAARAGATWKLHSGILEIPA